MKIAFILLLCYTAINASLPKCATKKQDGGWGDWLRWGPCTVTCGSGKQTRHRYCDNPVPKYGGAGCVGDSYQVRTCDREDCPHGGVYYEEKGECSRPCGGGTRTVSYKCRAPANYGTSLCYKDCPFKSDITEPCNTDKCDFPVQNVCTQCKLDNAHHVHSVGLACRVDKGLCSDLKFGIRSMYPANDWYFLHCSPDGPWCKPCATRTLVYNPACGQCEATRDGPCTGPNKWQTKRDPLSDDDLW